MYMIASMNHIISILFYMLYNTVFVTCKKKPNDKENEVSSHTTRTFNWCFKQKLEINILDILILI